jgi:hypothetical protein
MISAASRHEHRIELTANAWTEGPKADPGWLDSVAEWKWVTVHRYPVAPDLGLGYPVLSRPGENLEIVGHGDDHLLEAVLD